MDLSTCISEMPGGTRFVCLCFPVTFGLSMLLPGFMMKAFLFCPFTVMHGYIWTFVTSAFAQISMGSFSAMDILGLLITVYMVALMLPSLENAEGTVPMFNWILSMSAIIRVVFLAFDLVIDQLEQLWYFGSLFHFGEWQPYYYTLATTSMGVWPVIMMLIAMRSFSNPDGSTNFCGIIIIPNMWYPLLFWGLFAMLNQNLLLDMLCGLILGYLQVCKGWQIGSCVPSPGCAMWIESKLCGGRALLCGGRFIPCSAPQWLPGTARGAAQTQPPAPAPAQFRAFGGQGRRLGSEARESTVSSEPLLIC